MTEYMITAALVLDTALHIGVGKGFDPTDSPVRRTGDGRLLIPGRALAGSLRTLATRLAPRLGLGTCQALQKQPPKRSCDCTVCQLFGNVQPLDRPADGTAGAWTEATASRLWVYDAASPADTKTYVRDGVGIHRASGAAARNIKFDYELVPAGETFELKLRLAYDDGSPYLMPETAAKMKQLLAAVLAEWQAGRAQLGGNVSRGLGRFHLTSLTCRETRIETADDLVAYLAADDRSDLGTAVADWPHAWLSDVKRFKRAANGRAQSVAGAFVTITFDLQFIDFFLQNDPLSALLSGFDHAPHVTMVTDKGVGRPILSGASLRGALRSHAEKIARTLATHALWQQDAQTARDQFLVRCPTCDVTVRNKAEPLASCSSRLRDEQAKHAELPADTFCLSCQLFGNQERGSRLWVADAQWVDGQVTWQPQDFLAIDRFTGGGLDGAKFDAAPLVGAAFRTSLTLHDPVTWELGWLALLLRDLADERLTLGMGAAKGYGRVRAANVQWEVGYLTEDDLKAAADEATPDVEPAQLIPLLAAKASGVYMTAQVAADPWLPAGWDAAAQAWVDAFNAAVRQFEKSDDVEQLQADTAFDAEGQVLRLYGPARTEVT